MREACRLNVRTDHAGQVVSLRQLRSCAGLAAAIVPCAIIVHLVAESAATGREFLDASFVIRHSYFGVLFLAALLWFRSTVGLGQPARERRRRCALLLGELQGARRLRSLTTLVGANVGFFALTQFLEGIPIASGAVWLGLAIALAGSVVAALLVFAFGQSIVGAGLRSVLGTAPHRRAAAPPPRPGREIALPRHATSAYSLFVPNRPPPISSRL